MSSVFSSHPSIRHHSFPYKSRDLFISIIKLHCMSLWYYFSENGEKLWCLHRVYSVQVYTIHGTRIHYIKKYSDSAANSLIKLIFYVHFIKVDGTKTNSNEFQIERNREKFGKMMAFFQNYLLLFMHVIFVWFFLFWLSLRWIPRFLYGLSFIYLLDGIFYFGGARSVGSWLYSNHSRFHVVDCRWHSVSCQDACDKHIFIQVHPSTNLLLFIIHFFSFIHSRACFSGFVSRTIVFVIHNSFVEYIFSNNFASWCCQIADKPLDQQNANIEHFKWKYENINNIEHIQNIHLFTGHILIIIPSSFDSLYPMHRLSESGKK